MNIAQMLSNLTTAFVPVMLGIILHEVAHGWVASKRGDQTAKMLGRLTLNPIPHIDPMGLGMFVLTAVASPVIFGWAKPVPVNARNFKNPRFDMMLVSVAGPISNMLLALLCAFGFALMAKFVNPETLLNSREAVFFFNMLQVGIIANFALAWLNLLPLPPLDGSHIVEGFLPPKLAWQYSKLERYGMVILLVLLVTGIAGAIITPLIRFSANMAISLALAVLGVS